MLKKTIQHSALLASVNAYYGQSSESYELAPTEFENIFGHALHQESSRPACDSTGCKTGTAAASGWEDALSSHSHNDVNAVIDSFPALNQQSSIPACTSVEGSCKKGSAAAPPTDTVPTTANWGKMDSDWGISHAKDPAELIQLESIPAQTSVVGSKKTESIAKPPTDTVPTTDNWGKMDSDWGINHAKNTAELVQLNSESRPACTSFECQTGTAAYVFDKEKPGTHPMNYFVPNFGVDKEMAAQQQHLEDAEKKYGKWDLEKSKKIDRDYKVPNFGMDVDIIDSQDSLKSTQKSLDHVWDLKL